MKRSKRTLAALLSVLMLSTALSGCTLLQFDDPAEIKQQEEELEKQQSAALPDVKSLLVADRLVMDEHLTDAAGKEIAIYQARFPYFEAEDNSALQNINSYYETEFGHLTSDKDRVFKLAVEKPADVLRSSNFDYTLLNAPSGYVAVLRTFESVGSLGESGKIHTCDLFSGATGLHLKFGDVFSANKVKAVEMLRKDLAEWCKKGGHDTAWLEGLNDDLLCENFTLDAKTLYIGFDQGIRPDGSTLIELALEPYNPYMG
ncbi:MAG: hypothetical protein IKU95_05085 [Clostridia bacterium]|nr:hypothetical protein [Clostridia bacterium]